MNITGSAGAYVQSGKREAEIKRKYGFAERDRVNVYTLPKGQRGKKYCSFSYTPLSAKARRLRDDVAVLKGRIAAVEHSGLSPKERAKKLHALRGQLKYASCKLSNELGSLPRSGVVVLEEGEE